MNTVRGRINFVCQMAGAGFCAALLIAGFAYLITLFGHEEFNVSALPLFCFMFAGSGLIGGIITAAFIPIEVLKRKSTSKRSK